MDNTYKIFKVTNNNTVEFWKTPSLKDLKAKIHDNNGNFLEEYTMTFEEISTSQARATEISADACDKSTNWNLYDLFLETDLGVELMANEGKS